jgi:AP-4 complex subunit mu-1
MAKVFKDYCGVLTEESIRKNFILIYELLDEMVDFGYPQITSTETLKSHVHNEAIASQLGVAASTSGFMSALSSKSKSSSSASAPIAVGAAAKGSKQKNEIYVDIIERLTVLFNSNGTIVNSSIDGSIQMKSYLSGNPELRLALNEDLVIGKGGAYGSVILDDCNFHECVRLDEFESSKTLKFFPPEGEFSLMNYRITADFRPPFRIYPNLEEAGPQKLELSILLRAELPDTNHGLNVAVKIPMPRATAGVTFEILPVGSAGVHAEYNVTERKVLWTIRKLNGGSEMTLRVKIALDQASSSIIKREIGPIATSFEVPMYNVSNLNVKYLRISETHKSYNPYRWVRYITQSSSYVCRL